MAEIKFADTFTDFSDQILGIRRRHVVEAIQSADKVEHLSGNKGQDDEELLFTKHVKAVSPPHTLIIMASAKTLTVSHAFKIYPTLAPNLEDKNPLTLLKLLVEKFGLNIRIGDCEKKFYYEDKIYTKHLPAMKPLPFPFSIVNPNDHDFHSAMKFKMENLIQFCVHVGYCFSLDKKNYLTWLNNKGLTVNFQQEAQRLRDYAEKHIVPSVQDESFKGKKA